VGSLRAAVNAHFLLASLHPERAAERGGPGYHKRTAAARSPVARSELRFRLFWGLYFVAFGLTLVAKSAVWSQVVLFVLLAVAAAVWLTSFVRRRRQNRLRKST